MQQSITKPYAPHSTQYDKQILNSQHLVVSLQLLTETQTVLVKVVSLINAVLEYISYTLFVGFPRK